MEHYARPEQQIVQKLRKLETQVPDISLFVPEIRHEETAVAVWQPRSTIIVAFAISAVLWASIGWLFWLLIGR